MPTAAYVWTIRTKAWSWEKAGEGGWQTYFDWKVEAYVTKAHKAKGTKDVRDTFMNCENKNLFPQCNWYLACKYEKMEENISNQVTYVVAYCTAS